MKNFFEELINYDAEVYSACDLELKRQQHNIELIASENIVSKAVLLAAGTVLTNKYAEGFPGKRYYGGCQCVDVVEDIARERERNDILLGRRKPLREKILLHILIRIGRDLRLRFRLRFRFRFGLRLRRRRRRDLFHRDRRICGQRYLRAVTPGIPAARDRPVHQQHGQTHEDHSRERKKKDQKETAKRTHPVPRAPSRCLLLRNSLLKPVLIDVPGIHNGAILPHSRIPKKPFRGLAVHRSLS